MTTRTNPKYYSLELRARPRLLAERCRRKRRRHVIRLRGVERGADVQRRPERSIDLFLDAALPHAKVRRRASAVGHGTDCAACVWWCAPAYERDWEAFAVIASRAPRPRARAAGEAML